MPRLITLVSYSDSSPDLARIALLRARLEEEGIPYFESDDYSNYVRKAVRRGELKIMDSDLDRAMAILKETGLYTGPQVPVPPSESVLEKLIVATGKIPLAKFFSPEKRIIILLVAVAAIVTSIVYFFAAPDMSSRLTDRSWCVGQVTYNGKPLIFRPDGAYVYIGCAKEMRFTKGSNLSLPGLNLLPVNASWSCEKNILTITFVDEPAKAIYEGDYTVSFPQPTELLLQSPTTVIHAYQNSW